MSGQFQSTVNIYNALGIPGDLAFDGPMRSTPYNLVSTPAINYVGYAYTVTSNANPDTVGGSPDAGNATVGGTGVFAGILVNPKAYAANGTQAGGPLAATLAVPDQTIGELLYMGQIFVSLPGPANQGDLVTYDPLTGALNSIAPTATFTGSIAAGGAATADVLTVSAITVGTLAVGSLIVGAGVLPGTYIGSLGTGKGGTGTYNLTSINLQTVSSEAMTASNVPAPAFSATGTIAGTTLTISAVGSGQIRVGQQIFGTGILPNTVITAYGSGVGNTGTYTINNSQTITPGETITGPADLLVPHAVVDRFGATSSGGVAVIKLTN